MFEAIPADTPALRREAHRLRYQVYCVEHNFEDPAANPDGLERDEFDDHSVQGVLLHRPSGLTVGTVRLVLHRPGARHGSLPIHRICQDPRVHDFPFETNCELSRFAISKRFRRRVGDGCYGRREDDAELADDPRRMIPHIALGLMMVALQMGIAREVQHVCAVMEPALLRLVARFGFSFDALGPPVLYHGLRQPVYSNVGTLLDRVRRERPDIWEVVTDRGRLWPDRFETKPVAELASAA